MKTTILCHDHPEWDFRVDFWEDNGVELAWIDPNKGIVVSTFIRDAEWRFNLFKAGAEAGIVVIGAPWALV